MTGTDDTRLIVLRGNSGSGNGTETVVDAASTLPETVDLIMRESGLAGLPALES